MNFVVKSNLLAAAMRLATPIAIAAAIGLSAEPASAQGIPGWSVVFGSPTITKNLSMVVEPTTYVSNNGTTGAGTTMSHVATFYAEFDAQQSIVASLTDPIYSMSFDYAEQYATASCTWPVTATAPSTHFVHSGDTVNIYTNWSIDYTMGSTVYCDGPGGDTYNIEIDGIFNYYGQGETLPWTSAGDGLTMNSTDQSHAGSTFNMSGSGHTTYSGTVVVCTAATTGYGGTFTATFHSPLVEFGTVGDASITNFTDANTSEIGTQVDFTCTSWSLTP